jgi:signal peptidase I
MTRAHVTRLSREVFLTVGAVLGVLCIVATVAGFAFGIKPLVFQSGSMSPAIHTGDLGVARSVDAASVRRGDIVSVIDAGGSRVTHRVVNVAEQGDSRQLTLQGDANRKPDAEVYTTSRVERVLFAVPEAGYVVSAATGPIGLFFLGLYVAGLLSLIFRRRPDGPDDDGPTSPRRSGARRAVKPKGRTRATARTTAVVAFGATLLVASPATAVPWTDSVPVTGASLTAGTVAAPATMDCVSTGGDGRLTFPNTDPRFSYVIEYASSQTGAAESTRYVGPATAATISHTVSSGLFGGLGGSIYVRVYSAINVGSSYVWKSTGFRGQRLNVSLILGVVTCGTSF